jgi:2-oxoisovalerate dehydrogenase E1 component
MTIHSPSPQSTVLAAPPDAAERLLRYAYMKLARDFDSRFEALLLTGRVSKWYSEVGNEATTIPAGLALGPGDALCTLHRDLGAILAVYLDPARAFPGFGFGAPGVPDDRRSEPEAILHRLACQLLGKADGFSQGFERSFHYGYLAPGEGILHIGMISHLGTMIPVAAGCGFAFKQAGSDRLAINFIGDGSTSTGDFHEGLNMAAVWKLPLILVIENNRYAFSTPARLQYAAERLSDRALGYGIAGETVDGNDPDAMAEAFARAVARARAGDGPTLIEAMLGRMRGHSEGDDSLKVVPPDELAAYRAADPVPAYARRLEADGVLDAPTRQRLESRIAELVERAISGALDAAPPSPSLALRPVFAPIDPTTAPAIVRSVGDKTPGKEITYIDAINQGLLEEMERDESVVYMGQDIGAFEGAFRSTKGLHARWPHRVFDTPIAESGTLGIAIGAAILGYRPVVEMQFGDFISCGFNQIVNMAAKLYYRWEVPCPIVVRLPTGGGVGAGPFHSQNPEGWFAHTAGIKVVCPATAADARGLLKAAIRDPNPVMLFEHKFLYRRIKETLPEGDGAAVIGEARVMRPGRHLTLVGYGVSTWTCMEAAEDLAKEGVEAEVIDLRTLVPYDEETVLTSVKKTGRVLIVHEAQLTLGFGAEVAARLADAAFPWLDAPVRRVAYPDRPVPYARVLENVLLPSREKVLVEARALLAF